MRMKLLGIVSLVLLFAACDENNTTGEENPLFKTEPALQGVTAEIKKHPEQANLYFERASILDRLEMDTLALKDYKKAISLDSTKAEYYSAIGDMLFEHKDVEASVGWLEKALELNPDDKRAHMKLAKMFLFIKEYTKAFTEINTVLRQDVYNAEGYFLKGMIYKDMKDTAKAISNFQTATQVGPDFREAVLQLGIMYSGKNDKLALQYYDKAFKMDSTDVFPLYGKGVYYQNREDYEQAKLEYINTIRQDRYYINAYYNIGYIYMQQDSLEKAMRQYDIITKLEPQNPEGYMNRGLCYELMGKKDEAIIDYRQALVFDEEYKDAKEGLARLGAKQ
ncbi:MAG: tetratricopeptide repeat protein [Chitinophagales bacterium]|nr:tetratricopeptide repeat protein [Chitinophagaceae bacterium]MCB9063599.1 tetratricopeptide repeat protein [Chitinophagales bacterium]